MQYNIKQIRNLQNELDNRLTEADLIDIVKDNNYVVWTYDSVNHKLEAKLTDLAITDVRVDTTHDTIESFCNDNYTGTEFQEGDTIILTNATQGILCYMHVGTSHNDSTDFQLVNVNNIDNAYIRSLFSANSPLIYNPGNGQFSIQKADSTHDGYLSKEDYTVFAGKSDIHGSGSDNRVVRWDGTGNIQSSLVTLSDDGILTSVQTFRSGNGSAAIPTYSFVGDEDTGIYNPSNDVLTISTGGVNQLIVTPNIVTIPNASFQLGNFFVASRSLGRVGINSNAPTATLHVNGTVRFENIGGSDGTNYVLTSDGTGTAQWKDVNTFVTDKGSEQFIFKTIAVTGNQTIIIADQNSDTLTFKGINGIEITPDPLNDTLTFSLSSYDHEWFEDVIGATLQGGPGIDVVYDDMNGKVFVNNIDRGSMQNIFKTIKVQGSNIEVLAGTNNDSFTFIAGANVNITPDNINKTITISSAGANTEFIQDVIGSTITASLGIDANYDDTNNQFIITNTDRGSAQNIFKTISVAGQSNITSSSNNDFLIFEAGNNITITTNPATKKITITSSSISTEDVEDIVGNMVTSNFEDGLTATYNDASGKLEFINTDKGTSQYIFKTIAVQSDTPQSNVTANNNTDTLNFIAGNGILLQTNPTNKSIIISAKAGQVTNGFTGHIAYYPSDGTTVDDATTLFWDNNANRLGVNTITPTATLDVAGDVKIQLVQNATASDRHLVVENGVVKYRTSVQTRADIGAGTMNSFNLIDTNSVSLNINDNKFIKFIGDGNTVQWGSISDGTSASNPYTISINNTDKGSAQAMFKRIIVASNNTIVASMNNDALTFEAGSGIVITTDSSNKKLIITSNGINTEDVQDIVGEMFNGNIEDGISVDYIDATGKLNVINNDKGSGQNIFKTIQVANNATITANNNNDHLIFKAGSNITITTNATSKEITIDATTPSLSAEEVQDILGGMIAGNSEIGVDVTYDDAGAKINFTNSDKGSDQQIFKNVAVFNNSDIIQADSNNDTLTFKPGTGIIVTPDSNLDTLTFSISQEAVEDIVGAMVSDNTENGIQVEYDDLTGKLNFINTSPASSAYSFKTIELAGAPGTNVVATAPNDLLKLAKGTGIDLAFNAAAKTITISADTSTFISNLTFRDGDGSDLTLHNNNFLQFASGSGINVDFTSTSIGNSSSPFALTITNTDRGSVQNIFKNIQINGTTQFAANSNNDTINFIAGSGIGLSANPSNKSITITSSGGSGGGSANSGLAGHIAYYPSDGTTIDDASALFWDNINGRFGINNNAPQYGLDVTGNMRLTNMQPNSDSNARVLVASSDNVISTKTIQQLLTDVGNGTMNSFVVRDSSNTDKTIINNTYLQFLEGLGMDIVFVGSGTGTTGSPYQLKIENTDKGSDQNIFKIVQKAGDINSKVIADSNSDTFYLQEGNGIGLSFNQSTSTITISATGSGSGVISQEQVEDIVGGMLLLGTQTGMTVTYTDNSNTNPGWLNFINTDRGSTQNIFKNLLRVNGAGATLNTITAANNNDTIRFQAGTNMTLVFDENTNTVTFNSAGTTPIGGAGDDQTLTEVLVQGNSTGTNSILVENGRGLLSATSNSSLLFNVATVANGTIPESKSANIGTSETYTASFDSFEFNAKERLLFINKLPMLGIYNPTNDTNVKTNPFHANYVSYQDQVIDSNNGCFLITLDTQESNERQQVVRVPIKEFLDPIIGSGSGSGNSYNFILTDPNGNTGTVYSNNNIRYINGPGIDIDLLTSNSPFDIRVTNTDRGSDQYIFKRIYVKTKPDFIQTNNNNDHLTFVQGDGINIDINSADREIIISSTLVGAGNGAMTNEDVQDLIAATLVDGFGIDVVYNDGSDQIVINNTDRGTSQNIFKHFTNIVNSNVINTITADSNDDTIGFVGSGGVTLSFDETNSIITITGPSGAGFSTEDVQDIIGSTLVDGFGIDVVYNDNANQIVINNVDAGSSQSIFKNVQVKNKPALATATVNNDTLTLAEGAGITMTVTANKEVMISNSVVDTEFNYSVTTTNASPTDMSLGSPVFEITTPINEATYYDIVFVATDVTNGEFYSSELKLGVINLSGTASLVTNSLYQNDTVNTFTLPIFYTASVNSNNQLVLTVTGAANRTIKWIARGDHYKNSLV